MEGINIYSGEKGLGGKLTNPTELAKYKGCIEKSFPITYQNKRYPDVETAYKILKVEGQFEDNDTLMVCLIAQKFQEYPELLQEVQARGGVAFLEECWHFTSAKTASFQSWEGKGRQSRFIRNLIGGFEKALLGDTSDASGQSSLF